MQPEKARAVSASHREDAELVPIQIAEIGAIEAAAAIAWRAFIPAAQRKRPGVQQVDFLLRGASECDHIAIAAVLGLTIKRLRDPKKRTLSKPVDLAIARLHDPLAAQFREQIIVEGKRAVEISRADRGVPDHS